MQVTVKYDCGCEESRRINTYDELEELYDDMLEWIDEWDWGIAEDFFQSLDDFDDAFKMLDVDFWDFIEEYWYKFSGDAEKSFRKMLKAYNEFLKAIDPDGEGPQE